MGISLAVCGYVYKLQLKYVKERIECLGIKLATNYKENQILLLCKIEQNLD